MTPEEIRATILATPDALALVDAVRNNPEPIPDTVAIAAVLSAGRTRIAPRLIGDADVSLAIGIPDGPMFLLGLEDAATTRPATDASPEQLAVYATARQAWRSVQNKAFEIGNPAVRAAIDLFVGVLLTADQAVAIKALAEVPDPVSEWDVRCAILAADGGLLV